MSGFVPGGFRLAGVHCGIKSNPAKNDLTLIVADQPCVAAGVYTQNLIFAAPVAVDRARTPSPRIRAVVANSGNANACTGERGLRDALEMARLRRRRLPGGRRSGPGPLDGHHRRIPADGEDRAAASRRPPSAWAMTRLSFIQRRPRHPDHRSQPQGGPSHASTSADDRSGSPAWPKGRA